MELPEPYSHMDDWLPLTADILYRELKRVKELGVIPLEQVRITMHTYTPGEGSIGGPLQLITVPADGHDIHLYGLLK